MIWLAGWLGWRYVGLLHRVCIMGGAAGRLSSRAIRLELGPGSGAHTWHLRLWSKATRSQCTEGLGGEKGAERVAKVRRLRREGALCPISDGG